MRKFIWFVFILFFISGNFISCKRKDKGDPPAFILSETMLIDFSNFITASRSAENNFTVKGTETYNWETAAEIAAPWRTLTSETLLVPISAYKAASGQKVSHVSGGKWEWNYNVNVGGAIYKTRLTGEISGAQVNWEMYVSRDGSGGFSEFKWLDGTSNAGGTEGKWTFNKDFSNQTALLQIDWIRTGTNIEKIKYTYLQDGQGKNAYIEFGAASGSFDYYYAVHYYNTSIGRFSDANIEWIRSSGAGRIKSADYLNGVWKCWDAQKKDTECN